MSSFARAPVAADTPQPDPTKHVDYQLGMVLGKDDLTQEFTYLSTRDHMTARELCGYGTVTGLRVSYNIDPHGPRIIVDPGVAVSPRGEFIRVGSAQCAYLDDWLLQNKDDVFTNELTSPGRLRLFVKLCYRDCPTDNVPIPGEPCRSEDDAMQPSRWADDFILNLTGTPPQEREDLAIRGFAHWLHRLVPESSGITLSLDDFIAELRADADSILAFSCSDIGIDSPPISPPQMMPLSPIRIPAGQECEYYRAAFRIWVTEIRPRVHPDMITGGCGCQGQTNTFSTEEEAWLLLAEIELPVVPTGTVFQVDRSQVPVIQEECRPVLPSLRLLDEFITCGRDSGSSILPGPVQAAVKFGLSPHDGVADTYSRSDHSHGTPPLPKLAGDVNGPIIGNEVTALRGEFIRYAKGVKKPGNGQVLTYEVDHWEPMPLPKPAPPPKPLVSIIAGGHFADNGAPFGRILGGMVVDLVISTATLRLYTVKFDNIKLTDDYILKGTVVTDIAAPFHVLEAVDPTTVNEESLPKLVPAGQVRTVLREIKNALLVRVTTPTARGSAATSFAISGLYLEVSTIAS
jgi:hypothetical protein